MVEIMIVLAIIAIVMTAGIPSMVRAMQKDDLARAVNDIMEGCKMARDRAILQGIPYEFVVSAGGQLTVNPAKVREIIAEAPPEPGTNLEGSDAPRAVAAEPPTLQSGFPRQLGEDVMIQLIDVNYVDHMEAEAARVRFHPNGISDHFTVVLAWKGKQRTVNLDIITGTPEELIR